MRGVEKGNFYTKFCSILVVLMFVFTSCSKEEVKEGENASVFSGYSSLEAEILDLINDYRSTRGQRELLRLDEISKQAQLHTEHMLIKKEVCHHNFGNRYRILTEKAGAKAMGENVGYGYRNSGSFLEAWLNSSSHRKIIEGQHTHFGISAMKGEKTYVTLIFIRK